MIHENENENINPSMEIDNLLNINEKKLDQEEKITLLSSLSIDQNSLQENRKRKLNNKIVEEQEEEEEEKRRWNYENLSDHEIQEPLLQTITYDIYLRIKVNQWLETDRTLLLFIRQHASLLANYFSLQMELELYQSYAKMTEPHLSWLSTMSKTLLARNSIDVQCFQIQKYINKQLKNTEEEFRTMTEKLAKSISDQQQILSSPQVDMKLLTSSILTFVRQDQQRLNVKLIKKRYLLMLNMKDICLLHEFYDLQPDSEHLHIAEHIWQATINEQRTKKMNFTYQNPILGNIDYGHKIEVQKKLLLAPNKKDDKGTNILPINYLKLNIDLLMHIIESRQKILIQRLEFENDFNRLFVIDNVDDDSDDYNDHENNGDKQ